MERKMTMQRRRAPGQSLPLIALMIMVLVAMVGLSVDVGNTFNEERRAVASANAASLAGMNAVIRSGDLGMNVQVYDAIVSSLNANGVEVAPHGQAPTGNQVVLQASYLDPQGRSLEGMPDILPLTTDIPNNVGFVQVSLSGNVDTYFARVVGQSDLPISANAYAGQCSMGQGVYPIAVAKSNIDGGQMSRPVPPDANNDGIIDDGWRTINSGPYAGRTARYVYMRENAEPGSFGFIRWMDGQGQGGSNANSAQELALSVRGEGNLSWGFNEAREEGAPRGQLNAEGSTYPSRPGELNEGDWVYGSSGRISSVEPEIQAHVQAGTIMTLPIYDRTYSDNGETAFRVVEFGRFVILDWERTGNNPYFEMVYLGSAVQSTVACQFSAVPVPDDDCCELWGDVAFWPEYKIVPESSQPIQYIVVLDVSGSMSANFNGQCNNNNPPLRNPQLVGQPPEFVQCANGPTYISAVDGSTVSGDTEVTGTGPTHWWLEERERRIYVAKHAIEAMILQLYMPGNAKYEEAPNLYPPDQFGFVVFNTDAPSSNAITFSNNQKFTSNPADAISKVINYRNISGENYRVQGGTNAAGGLYRAWQTFQNAPTQVYHAATQRDYTYKRVVIFITDGVANTFLSTSDTNLNGGSSRSNTFSESSVVRDENGQIIAGSQWRECNAAGDRAIELANCQTTLYGGRHNGMDRPITQAINVSNDLLKSNSIEVFALALSSLSATGLQSGIPYSPAHYRSAADLVRNPDGSTNVDQIMLTFQNMVADGRCQRGLDPAPISTFAASSFRSIPLMTGGTLSYPNVGQVTIHNSVTNQSFTTFIKVDQDGQLRYRFGERIPPGIYSLNADLYYVNPNEPNGTNGPARLYGTIWTGAESMLATTVEVANRSNAGSLVPSTRANLDLRLTGDVCAAQ
ncbi:MAG: VWA domain-containing protein [Candidatus Viridilinea halotolerans]|uniref:VWA domain-containing protein n=1 Tax=Candidatus Viridilinea halotolerans TaxID=2491704 RepID=A0A426TR00_9CHLR|nr:MAG: VWA domain-containing protein [Candidatus Viridilinea halotolerans]